jgi:hypothetical protein
MGRIISAALLLLIASFSPVMAAGESPAAGLANRHTGRDLKVAWQETEANGNLVVRGIIGNVRYVPVADFDVAVFLMDGQNRIVARNRAYPLPTPIVDHDYVPFSVTFRDTPPDRVKVVAFSIRYRNIDEGGWWNSTFRYDLAAGREIKGRSLFEEW